MRRSVSLAGLSAALVLEMGAHRASQKNFVASEQQKPETMEVKIDNFSFGPGTLTAPVGTTVTWTNRDDIPHTVVSTDGLFKSKVLDTDEKFSYTFSKAGTYPYFCSIHPKMTGKVVVRSESGAMRNLFDIRAELLAKHAQHGVLIHFPIALFIAGVAFDLLAEWTRRATYARVAHSNLALAAISTIPVLGTGFRAWQWDRGFEGILLVHRDPFRVG